MVLNAAAPQAPGRSSCDGLAAPVTVTQVPETTQDFNVPDRAGPPFFKANSSGRASFQNRARHVADGAQEAYASAQEQGSPTQDTSQHPQGVHRGLPTTQAGTVTLLPTSFLRPGVTVELSELSSSMLKAPASSPQGRPSGMGGRGDAGDQVERSGNSRLQQTFQALSGRLKKMGAGQGGVSGRHHPLGGVDSGAIDPSLPGMPSGQLRLAPSAGLISTASGLLPAPSDPAPVTATASHMDIVHLEAAARRAEMAAAVEAQAQQLNHQQEKQLGGSGALRSGQLARAPTPPVGTCSAAFRSSVTVLACTVLA
jgi:hypothetical protein